MRYSHNLSHASASSMSSFLYFCKFHHLKWLPLVRSLAAHILASLCMGVACVVLVLHYMHFRERRDIHLTHPPGSIGSALALTAHSGFGELLLPYDNVEEFSRALAPLRFCLDRRTGAIVVDDNSIMYAEKVRAPLVRPIRDETVMTLIGKDEPVGLKSSSGAEQYNDSESFEIRTPSLNSPDICSSDAAQASFFNFRSSVSLIPTPGAVSKRHPTYVCHCLPMKVRECSFIHGLRRNRSYRAFGLLPWGVCCLAP